MRDPTKLLALAAAVFAIIKAAFAFLDWFAAADGDRWIRTNLESAWARIDRVPVNAILLNVVRRLFKRFRRVRRRPARGILIYFSVSFAFCLAINFLFRSHPWQSLWPRIPAGRFEAILLGNPVVDAIHEAVAATIVACAVFRAGFLVSAKPVILTTRKGRFLTLCGAMIAVGGLAYTLNAASRSIDALKDLRQRGLGPDLGGTTAVRNSQSAGLTPALEEWIAAIPSTRPADRAVLRRKLLGYIEGMESYVGTKDPSPPLKIEQTTAARPLASLPSTAPTTSDVSLEEIASLRNRLKSLSLQADAKGAQQASEVSRTISDAKAFLDRTWRRSAIKALVQIPLLLPIAAVALPASLVVAAKVLRGKPRWLVQRTIYVLTNNKDPVFQQLGNAVGGIGSIVAAALAYLKG